MERKYYEAYDDRYRQVHGFGLQWSGDEPAPIVAQVLQRYPIGKTASVLELGCGEGADAAFLLRQGYRLLATDISPAVIEYDRKKYPEYADHFGVLDCIRGNLPEKFDFIYAVAVIHMLVEDEDRAGFYRFIRKHLTPGGKALICTMGDGTMERKTDPGIAFELQERTHQATGRQLKIAATTCRMVTFDRFRAELKQSGLGIVEEGLTHCPPDFPVMMYAVCEAAS